jgi:hypothetical protein
MTRILDHLKRQAVAYIALFVALGGTGYAAIRLPAGSVGTRVIKNHSITPIKFAHDSIAGYMRAYVQINPQGQITASRPGAKVIAWRTGSFEPGGLIQWNQPILASCFALATTTAPLGNASYASALLASAGAKDDAQTYVLLSAAGQPVNIAVMCPQP